MTDPLEQCQEPLELVNFVGYPDNTETRFVTVDVGSGESSSDRPLRSGSFMSCSGYIFVNNKSSLALLLHMTPVMFRSGLDNYSSKRTQALQTNSLNPFFRDMRAIDAEVTLIPVLGIGSLDKTPLLAQNYGRAIKRITEPVLVPGKSRIWHLSYQPMEQTLFVKNEQEDSCFTLPIRPSTMSWIPSSREECGF